jgi:hypothetical protein
MQRTQSWRERVGDRAQSWLDNGSHVFYKVRRTDKDPSCPNGKGTSREEPLTAIHHVATCAAT